MYLTCDYQTDDIRELKQWSHRDIDKKHKTHCMKEHSWYFIQKHKKKMLLLLFSTSTDWSDIAATAATPFENNWLANATSDGVL